jgi:hypothetical protein
MVLDQNDLKSIFDFNPEGDIISIIYDDFWTVADQEFRFGNIEYSKLVAPGPNQSIAVVGYDYWGNIYSDWNVIEQPPTIGSNPFAVYARGNLEGFIYDQDMNPIPGITILEEETNEDGYFFVSDLFCRIDNYIHIKHNDNIIYTFTDTIFPYDTAFVEIQLDTLFVSIPEYHNYPNPFSSSTSFKVQIPDNLNYNTAYVCIYNMSGRLVDRIEVPKGQSSVSWQNTENNPGIYLYKLVVDDTKYATQKMIAL